MTAKTRSQIQTDIGNSFPTNSVGAITAAALRGYETDLTDSTLFPADSINTNLVTATSSTTARTLERRFADAVSILDFQSLVSGGDWQLAFQAAANLGRPIRVPKSVTSYDIGSPVICNLSGTQFIGDGTSYANDLASLGEDSPVVIKALPGFAPASGVMFDFYPTAVATNPLYSVGMSGIEFDGNNVADCLRFRTIHGVIVQQVLLINAVDAAMSTACMTTAEVPGIVAAGANRATKHFDVNLLIVRNSGSARGLVLDGDGVGTVNSNIGEFGTLNIFCQNGNCIDLYDCDSIIWRDIQAYNSGTGIGMVFNGSTSPDQAARQHFVHRFQGVRTLGTGGGMEFVAGGINPTKNIIVQYSTGNSTPDPIFGAGTAGNNLIMSYDNLLTMTGLSPVMRFWATTPTPSVADFAGGFEGYGQNAIGTDRTWGRIRINRNVFTDGLEDARWRIETIQDGTLGIRGHIGNGWTVGSPATGDLGDGTLNVENRIRLAGFDVNSTGDVLATQLDVNSGSDVAPGIINVGNKEKTNATQVGRIGFDGFNASSTKINYGTISVNETVVTAGAEDGSMFFQVYDAGASTIALTLAKSLNTPYSMKLCDATAIPAGGTAGTGYKFSSTANFGIFFGSGAPSLSAAKGSLYLRSDGSGVNDRAYINTNGSTTWTALVTVG